MAKGKSSKMAAPQSYSDQSNLAPTSAMLQGPTPQINRILAGGLSTLFFSLVIAALQVSGIISMTLTHTFLVAAFIVGALLISTEMFPGKPAKHKAVWTTVLALAVIVVDLLILSFRPLPQKEAEASISTPSVWSVLTVPLGRLNELPWRWITPSLTIGTLIAALVGWRLILSRKKKWQDREKELQGLVCPEPILHEHKADDKDRIRELVRLAGMSYQPHFDRGTPYIDFVFSVFNISLYDIVIDNSIKKGAILYSGDFEKFFYEPKFEADQPIICRSRASAYFAIHQAVRAEEVTRFQKAENLLIAFDRLEIKFRPIEQPSAAETDPTLELKQFLETKKGVWRPLERLELVFGYTAEQWAALTSPERTLRIGANRVDEGTIPIDIQMLTPVKREVLINMLPALTLAIPFRNDVIATKDVIAHVKFVHLESKQEFNVNYGVWLEAEGHPTRFGIGDTRHLILLGHKKLMAGDKIVAYDDKHISKHGAQAIENILGAGTWAATIDLVGPLVSKTFPEMKFAVAEDGGCNQVPD